MSLQNPKLEDGYTPIANPIMDAFARTQFSGNERRVLDVILRKTYGWSKPSDAISLSQFVDATGLHKTHIVRALKDLTDRHIIRKTVTKIGNDQIATYEFNKHYGEWIALPKLVTLPELVTKPLPKLVPTITRSTTTSKGLVPPTPTEPVKKPRASRTPKITFNRETRQFVGLTPELIDQLRSMYPGVDVDQVLREVPDWAMRTVRLDYWGSIKAFCKHDLERMKGGQYGNGANRQANYRPSIAGSKFTGEDFIRGVTVGAEPGSSGTSGRDEEG